MSEEADIVDGFNRASKMIKKGSNADSYKYRELDACHKGNHGTIVGRIIPDTTGLPYYIMQDLYEMKLPVTYDNGKGEARVGRKIIRQPEEHRFNCTLTEGQKSLLVDHNKVLNILWETENMDIWTKEYRNLAVVFMLIQKIIPATGKMSGPFTDPKLSVMTHVSAEFGKNFDSTYHARSKSKGIEWSRKWFNRNKEPNQNITSITTRLKSADEGIGYKVDVLFDDSDIITQLTDEHLATSKSLADAWMATTYFDEERYVENLKFMKEFLEAQGSITISSEVSNQPPKSEGKNESDFEGAGKVEKAVF